MLQVAYAMTLLSTGQPTDLLFYVRQSYIYTPSLGTRTRIPLVFKFKVAKANESENEPLAVAGRILLVPHFAAELRLLHSF
jgi:hypothetical protein